MGTTGRRTRRRTGADRRPARDAHRRRRERISRHPRGCSLEELGEQLGISRSATSERFRRGVKNLVLESL
ncbi:helix-turn-helix domain-containing protein [Halomicroarcula sp. GCM10025710]